VSVEDGPLNDIPSVVEPKIQNPIVSPLLAMGVSGPRLSRRWLFGIAIAGSLLVGLVLFTLLFSGTFFLPPHTISFATVAPRTLNTLLTSEQKTALPVEWQQTLREDSRWPVVFGLTGSRETIQAFTLGPRWAVPAPLLQTTDTKTRALVRQVGVVTPENDQPLVYRELFFDQVFAPGSLRGWLDASLLFPNASSSNRILFFADKGKIILSDTDESLFPANQLTLEAATSPRPLQADVSLHLAALGKQTNVEVLLGELPLDPVQTTLTSLREAPATLEARFTTSTIDALRLTFQRALRPEERAALLSELNGTRKRQLFTLPDGTVGVEYLAEATVSSTSTPNTDTINWLAPSGAAPLEEATACGQGMWLARFSPRLLERFVLQGSNLSAWIPKQPLQIWRDQKQLVICLER
jgi:hypothetical protein